jgi:outer membrane protein TolC
VSNIKVQKALQERSILSYRQTVLTAIQEVENALVASTKEQERRRSLEAAVDANRRAAKLTADLYGEGHTDFLNVLSAQQSLYSSEDSLVQSTRTTTLQWIALYKALGGGWDEATSTVAIPSKGKVADGNGAFTCWGECHVLRTQLHSTAIRGLHADDIGA